MQALVGLAMLLKKGVRHDVHLLQEIYNGCIDIFKVYRPGIRSSFFAAGISYERFKGVDIWVFGIFWFKL